MIPSWAFAAIAVISLLVSLPVLAGVVYGKYQSRNEESDDPDATLIIHD